MSGGRVRRNASGGLWTYSAERYRTASSGPGQAPPRRTATRPPAPLHSNSAVRRSPPPAPSRRRRAGRPSAVTQTRCRTPLSVQVRCGLGALSTVIARGSDGGRHVADQEPDQGHGRQRDAEPALDGGGGGTGGLGPALEHVEDRDVVGPGGRHHGGQPERGGDLDAERGRRHEEERRRALAPPAVLDREVDRGPHAREALPLRRPPLGELDGLSGGDRRGRRRAPAAWSRSRRGRGPAGGRPRLAARRGAPAPAPYFRPSWRWRVFWIFWRTLSLAGSSSSDFSQAESADGSSPALR